MVYEHDKALSAPGIQLFHNTDMQLYRPHAVLMWNYYGSGKWK